MARRSKARSYAHFAREALRAGRTDEAVSLVLQAVEQLARAENLEPPASPETPATACVRCDGAGTLGDGYQCHECEGTGTSPETPATGGRLGDFTCTRCRLRFYWLADVENHVAVCCAGATRTKETP